MTRSMMPYMPGSIRLFLLFAGVSRTNSKKLSVNMPKASWKPFTAFRKWINYRVTSPPIQREKPWGTAHAIWAAKDHIHEPFIAINADDFYGRDAFVKMHDFIADNQDERCFSLAGYQLAATLSENGTVSRGICTVDQDNFLTSITERTKIGREGDTIKDMNSGVVLQGNDVVSMNFWGFSPILFGEIEKQFVDFYHKNSDNPKAEIYIPFVVDELIKQKAVKVKVLNTSAKWFGVTYKEDTELVNNALQKFDGEGLYTDMGQ